jgi:hypothetical protein
MTWLSELAATSLVIWLYLLLGRDGCGRAPANRGRGATGARFLAGR